MTEYEKMASFMKPDYVTADVPIREPIARLASLFDGKSKLTGGGEKITADNPTYWGLAAIATDEEAELALKMGIRKPKTFEQLLKLSGKTAPELKEMLRHMSYTGLLEYNQENLDGKNPKGDRRWVLPVMVPGVGEFTNMNEKLITEHPELGRFFERKAYLALPKTAHLIPPGGAGVGMHVIPVEKSISMEEQSVPIEHISHWLEKYDGKYAASPCSCRLSRTTYDDNCGDDFHDWCIAVGDMADYIVETGKGGRYITKEEVLEILKQAEDNGFVHQITNIDGENKIFAICNCNVNVCYALRTSQLFNTPNLSRSAYVAHVDKTKCVACGRCVEYCPAGAVKLGQKLCHADGSEVSYPRQALPTEEHWGPEKWAFDYRDRNRVNCHDTGTSPCKTACPAHIAVQGYLKLASQGRYREALALIKRENPFPAVCGRICNRRCEDACTRGGIDQAVAIDEVKRFIAEQDLHADTRYIPQKVIPKVQGEFDEKIAVIGGGPAGLSCAFYLAEKGYRPTVFEKESRLGGMLMNGIPSFRLEKDVVQAEIDILKEMGVEFRLGVEVGKDITIPQLREQGYRGFYLAVGLQSGGKLNVPNGDSRGVMAGIDFMRRVNLGEDVAGQGNLAGDGSENATGGGNTVTSGAEKMSGSVDSSAAGGENAFCHGNVVVIGGGNVACDVARTAARCGADKVDMYCLESYDEMPCGVEDRTETEADGITIHAGFGPAEIICEDGRCREISFKKCLSVRNSEGRFDPAYDETDTCKAEADFVFYCTGQKVFWKDLLQGTKAELNPNGTVIVDPVTYQTADPDIFAGGDVCTGQKFVIDAIAAGKEAAISLHRYVRGHSTLVTGRNRRNFVALDKNDIRIDEDSFDSTPRQRTGYADALKRTLKDSRIPYTEEQVMRETARCLGCGVSVVDPNKCIGCGLCTTKCAFDAISISRDRPQCSKMVRSEDKMKHIVPYVLKQEVHICFGKKER